MRRGGNAGGLAAGEPRRRQERRRYRGGERYPHLTRESGAADLLRNRKTVVEGYLTTESFAGLCGERAIDAPILGEMRSILFADRRPSEALAALMARGLKGEAALSK